MSQDATHESNPEIEESLDALAKICCDTLRGDDAELEPRSKPLLKTLLMSGYVRKTGRDVRADIEARVKASCAEPAMHRGAALSSITGQMQKTLDDLLRWESEQPRQSTPPKAANISSATDA